jgi:hypothetical protein
MALETGSSGSLRFSPTHRRVYEQSIYIRC